MSLNSPNHSHNCTSWSTFRTSSLVPWTCSVGGLCGHGSVGSHHEGQSTDELAVSFDLWVRGQVNPNMRMM